MNHRVCGLVLPLLLIVPASIWAAEAEYDFVHCGNAKLTPIESSADITVLGLETWGIVSSTASTTKAFEKMTHHCVGYVHVAGGKRTMKGVCKYIDTDGDVLTGEFETLPEKEGVWTFLAGTGKFKGIKGAGTYRTTLAGKPVAEGTSQTCTRATGKYSTP